MNAIACSVLGRAYEQMSHLAAPNAELKNHGVKGCIVVVSNSLFLSVGRLLLEKKPEQIAICLDTPLKMNNS